MKPWLVEVLTLSAGLALALATLAGVLAMSPSRPSSPAGCGEASLALTLAFEPSLDPVGILAGVDAASQVCQEPPGETLSD